MKRKDKGPDDHHDHDETTFDPVPPRDAAQQAKVERRILRFLNEARFPDQLLVAPHDRFAID